MTRTNCPGVEALSAFALGKLAETELTEIADHLDSCAACERLAGQLDGTDDMMVSELRRFQNVSIGTEPAPSAATGTEGPQPSLAPMVSWGEFRIMRELGRGGMGVVYEAYQGTLNRHVALKLLPIHGDITRFRREARAAGRLHHSNIVPVFGVGEHQGQHFYVMQFISGCGLDAVLKNPSQNPDGEHSVGSRFDERRVAQIGVQVAVALAYAHGQGVVHRDIKPSNLLLDQQATVWVTDFGLAHDASDTVTLTHTGDFLGTLRYLAPERISGKGDHRSDLYSLGVTLYELLTGRPTHPEQDRAVLVDRILNHEPVPPRKRAPGIARDLETIVLKAIARDPEKRYATAEALAEDLRRFLDDRPILARRVGYWERAVRWSRRNKLAAGLLAALLLAILSGFAGVTVEWQRANAEAIRANQKALAETQARTSEAAARAAERVLRIQAQEEIATRDFDQALELARTGRVEQGLLWMTQALKEAPPERTDFERLVRANLSDWTTQVLRRRAVLDHRKPGPETTQFSPDGRLLMTLGDDNAARVWDTASGRLASPPLVHPTRLSACVFSSNGRSIATGCQDGTIRVWDVSTAKPSGPVLGAGANQLAPVTELTFSSDGKLLISLHTDQTRILWDVESGRRIDPPKQADRAIPSWFLPNQNRVVLLNAASEMVGIWDTAAGSLAEPTIRGDRLGAAHLYDVGCVLGISADGRTVRLWEISTGKLVTTLPQSGSPPAWAALSPDRRFLFVRFRNASALLWDVTKHRVDRSVLPETRFNPSGDFSPDGRWLLTVGRDSTAQIREVATGRLIGSPIRHELPLRRTSFSPDGRLVIAIVGDGTSVLWDVGQAGLWPRVGASELETPRQRPADATPYPGGGLSALYSRDTTRILANCGRFSRIIDSSTGQPIGRPMLNPLPLVGPTAISPDGRLVANSSRDRGFAAGGSMRSLCQIFDAETGRSVSSLLPHVNWVSALAFSPDSKVLASGDYSGVIHLWNAETGALLDTPLYAGAVVQCVAFSPNGRFLAIGTNDPQYHVLIWDLTLHKLVSEPIVFSGWVSRMAFSPDSASLAAVAQRNPAKIIDTATGRVRAILRHEGSTRGVSFSTDGRLILTYGVSPTGGEARIWDAATGEPISPLIRRPGNRDFRAVLNPSGTAWAMSRDDMSVWIWDVATKRPIGPPRLLRDQIAAMAFGPDGQSLLTIDKRGNALTWPVASPMNEKTEDLVRRIQVLTVSEIDSGGAAAFLAQTDWDRLRTESGDPMWNAFKRSPRTDKDITTTTPDPDTHAVTDRRNTTKPSVDIAWHEANARDAEASDDSYGAQWHLDMLIAAKPDDGLLRARRAQARLWAGEADAAGADIKQAIRLGPPDRILDWLNHRALDALSEKRPADALRLLEPVIAARPNDWLTYALRAEAYAALNRTADREADLERAIAHHAESPFLLQIADERARASRWRDAALLYDQAIDAGAVPHQVWMRAAIAHLEIGDQQGFIRICETLSARFPSKIPEIFVVWTLSNALTVGPGGIGGGNQHLKWSESLLASVTASKPTVQRLSLSTLGKLLYRAGNDREAIARINEAVALDKGAASPEETLFLALAHYRMGDRDRARSLLNALRNDTPIGPSDDEWWDAQGRRLLRHEAERVILVPSVSLKPGKPPR